MGALCPCLLDASNVTTLMQQRGYGAKLHQTESAITYSKGSLKVTLTEYSPLVKIGDAIYFLAGFPRIGITGLVLDEDDLEQILEWLSFCEAEHLAKKNKTKA